MDKLKELVNIIEQNPNCSIDIDNDYWEILSREPQETDNENDEPKTLAHSDQYGYETEWYGHSSNYGFGIAEALKIILNKKGFNLTIRAV
jgi:hypothetical protein